MEIDKSEHIRNRAYAIWEEEGRPVGSDLRHWAQAAAELDALTGSASVDITTGREPARKKVKKTEGP